MFHVPSATQSEFREISKIFYRDVLFLSSHRKLPSNSHGPLINTHRPLQYPRPSLPIPTTVPSKTHQHINLILLDFLQSSTNLFHHVANRHREILQQREGFWVYHSRPGRRGRVRALLPDPEGWLQGLERG